MSIAFNSLSIGWNAIQRNSTLCNANKKNCWSYEWCQLQWSEVTHAGLCHVFIHWNTLESRFFFVEFFETTKAFSIAKTLPWPPIFEYCIITYQTYRLNLHKCSYFFERAAVATPSKRLKGSFIVCTHFFPLLSSTSLHTESDQRYQTLGTQNKWRSCVCSQHRLWILYNSFASNVNQ